MTQIEQLPPSPFIVSPHIVQDLGLNLYSDVIRVLVEYVANAYDADADWAEILIDKNKIDDVRKQLRSTLKEASEQELSESELPSHLSIIIQDNGIGMSLDEIKTKFLVAGRRRREEECSNHTAKGRALMGRKGLGKLAGFGVARQIKVISRNKDDDRIYQVTLDYDQISKKLAHERVEVPTEVIDFPGFPPTGTRIVLSRLLYEPMKSRVETIENNLSSFFWAIDEANFRIKINGSIIPAQESDHSWAWPNPELPPNQLVDGEVVSNGIRRTFKYRLRFLADRKALDASQRGVRVYCHRRLAMAPNLLKATTNMHGFRMTDYLDGVVYADFIDDQKVDYIATDRQGLRWDSPILQPLYEYLSEKIDEACYERQKVRDLEKIDEVKSDKMTQDLINAEELTKREREAAYRIARALAAINKQGVEDPKYKEQIKEVVKAVGKGEIVAHLRKLSESKAPELREVVTEVTKLTDNELDAAYRFVRGRLFGITALRKIVMDADFRKPDNERQIHDLLNKCPWLIRQEYFRYVSSNETNKVTYSKLAAHLKIGKHCTKEGEVYTPTEDDLTPIEGDNKRPDLVFALSDELNSRVVIVELKSPNTPLHDAHYRQLGDYIRRCERFISNHLPKSSVQVSGLLLGTHAEDSCTALEVERLKSKLQDPRERNDRIEVKDFMELLEESERAHKELIEAAEFAFES